MQISPYLDRVLHQRLPIDSDEKILSMYKHHWFIYLTSWVIGVLVAGLVIGGAVALTMFSGDSGSFAGHTSQVVAGAGILAVLILLGSFIPSYLYSQEQLVLTEESLLQVLQPSLFASKTNQLSLQHVTDVMVQRDFFGTIFGYGTLTVETPGEQNNFVFRVVPEPDKAAREITHAHENYIAALESGQLHTTLGGGQSSGPQQSGGQGNGAASMAIDPQQYEQFLAYQRMVAQAQQQQAQQQNTSQQSGGQPGTNS